MLILHTFVLLAGVSDMSKTSCLKCCARSLSLARFHSLSHSLTYLSLSLSLSLVLLRYEEDKFRKVDLPPRKKKGSDDSAAGDAGWETGAKKGKGATNKTTYANKKPPVPLTFPGFSPKVAEMLQQCHEAGIVTKGELDERVMEDLKILPERGLSRLPPNIYIFICIYAPVYTHPHSMEYL